MKPTLKQLKKRPALWVDGFKWQLRISYPDGSMDFFNGEEGPWRTDRLALGDAAHLHDFWHEHAKNRYAFVSWL